MTKLELLLREYWDRRWQKRPNYESFCFDTEKERDIFIKRLEEIGHVKYDNLGGPKNCYSIDVYKE